MRERWGSRAGFVLTTAGFSVGLGNIWRFPYLTGENGGGAFLVVYVAIAVAIGIPLLTAELGMGRASRLTPIAGMARLTGSARSPWNLIGWIGTAAAVLITSYYVMLIAWLAAYFVMFVGTGGPGGSPSETRAAFEAFTGTPGPVIGYAALIVVLMALVVSRGVAKGIERYAKVLMPLLVLLLGALAVRAITLPGAGAGVVWYLTPDLSALTGSSVLAALGQAFFSIGIGMATAFGLGSYLDAEGSDVPGNAAMVVAFDTGVAVIAGFVLFPALFAFGMDPDQGAGLLFVTMTALFEQMPGGVMFGAAFFFLLLVAGFTSQVAVFEILVASAGDSLRMRRSRAVVLCAVGSFVICVPVILSQGPWSHVELLGMDLFDFVNRVSGDYMIAVAGLLISLFVVSRWGWSRFRDQVNRGAGRFQVSALWRPLVRFIIPVAVAIVLMGGFGLGAGRPALFLGCAAAVILVHALILRRFPD
ncbi:MAG: sodium-dependent transporter [Gemmatimonadetes bacterium]|nr:sodium-dependent transporter [Gemmatimonadota bacterium]MYI06068.1 sodium-dependent transporter [Gemmatimonadota bacterium]